MELEEELGHVLISDSKIISRMGYFLKKEITMHFMALSSFKKIIKIIIPASSC